MVEERPRRKDTGRRREGRAGGRVLSPRPGTLEGGPLDPTPLPIASAPEGTLRAFRLGASCERTVTSAWSIPPRSGLLVLNRGKALAIRPEGAQEGAAVPPESAWIGIGSHFHVRAAKGLHDAWIVTWPLTATPLLKAPGGLGPASGCGRARSLQLGLEGAAERLSLALEAAEETGALGVIGVIYEVAAATGPLGASASDSPSALRLTPWPPRMTPAIAEIAAVLREESGHGWNLRSAAARAGYSPHHFSRLFKATFGFGFQGYLERVRTESAIRMLQTGDADLATLAAASGFSSPAKLREALRTFVGFSPNDLRNIGR